MYASGEDIYQIAVADFIMCMFIAKTYHNRIITTEVQFNLL